MGNAYDDVNRDLKQVLRLISLAEERLDGVLLHISTIHPKQHDLGRRKLNGAAEPLSSLVVTLKANGSSRVAVNDKNTFRLSPRLTELLLFALSGEVDSDGLKSYRLQSDAIAENALNCTPNTLSTLVHQLRDRLQLHDLDSNLLETRRQPSRIRFLARNVLVIQDHEN